MPDVGEGAARGRIRVRVSPHEQPDRHEAQEGAEVLDVHGGRLLVPYEPAHRDVKRPVVVALHGAGAYPQQMLDVLAPAARAEGILVFAVRSAASTWDLLLGGFGPDVLALQTGLDEVLQRDDADAGRIALAGFSDGASYALSLGLGNGDVFGSVLAWSPGFAAPAPRVGTPRVFVSHGVHDRVLPVDRCSRRIVPRLRREGYPVEYLEFDGPHVVPAEVVTRSVAWWLGAA